MIMTKEPFLHLSLSLSLSNHGVSEEGSNRELGLRWDAAKSHPSLLITDDRLTVKCNSSLHWPTCWATVGFSEGRHYW